MGNICRSPAAEIVFRHLVERNGLSSRVEIDSAGTIDYHRGKGPDSRMAATLRDRGYAISGRARQVTAADLEHFDLILVADEENLRNVRSLDPAGSYRAKIRLLVEFCETHDVPRVPDPYYGGQRGFDEVVDLVEDAADGLLKHVKTAVG